MRAILFGVPVDEYAKPKTIPDYESYGACWVLPEVIFHYLKLLIFFFLIFLCFAQWKEPAKEV